MPLCTSPGALRAGKINTNSYSQLLAAITNEAIKNGVPAQEIILHLELASHELKKSFLALATATLANKSMPAIIVPGNGRMPS